MNQPIKFVFFGNSDVSAGTLEVLGEHGLIPRLIVSGEDKPKGRGLKLTPTPTKLWAEIHEVPIIQPKTLRDDTLLERLRNEGAEVFIVVDYPKLIPRNIFELPPQRTLNIHYSLLPRWRGASPIHSTILNDDKAGVSIMEIVEKLDEGPVIATQEIEVLEWPPRFDILRKLMIKKAAELIVVVLPKWLSGEVTATSQDDSKATYCKKIEKEDGLLDLGDDPMLNLRKVRAYYLWPGAYFFYKKGNGEEIRVLVRDAQINENKFVLTRVVPAGKKEMDWQDFLRGNS